LPVIGSTGDHDYDGRRSGMNRVCRVATIVFLFVYLAALALFIIGTFGLFGQDRDPLSAVFLMPLGLPWNLMLDVFPDPRRTIRATPRTSGHTPPRSPNGRASHLKYRV
jgi:hypothetical protein